MNLQDFINANHGVLVVGDVVSARKIVMRLLGKLGIKNVSEAANGKDALETLKKKGGVNLIISDWSMPEMDGMQLLASVRANGIYLKLPFILITSSADREEVLRAFNAGVTDYMVKPFNADTIARKLTSVLTNL